MLHIRDAGTVQKGTISNISSNGAESGNVTISGGSAVVFTAAGEENYLLRSSADLAQDTSLLSGKIFEIPAGMNLGLSRGVSLVVPADARLLFGDGYGSFTCAGSTSPADGGVVYSGEKPAAQETPAALPGVLAGLGIAAVAAIRKL